MNYGSFAFSSEGFLNFESCWAMGRNFSFHFYQGSHSFDVAVLFLCLFKNLNLYIGNKKIVILIRFHILSVNIINCLVCSVHILIF